MTNELHSHTGVIRGSRGWSRGVKPSSSATGTLAVGCGENLGFTRVLHVLYARRATTEKKSLLVTVVYCESRIDN